MSVSASSGRYVGRSFLVAGFAAVGLLAGCAPTNQNANTLGVASEDSNQTIDSAVAAYENSKSYDTADASLAALSIDQYLATASRTNRNLIDDAQANLAVQVYNQPGTTRLVVKTGDEVPAFNVTTLSSPSRIVLDLPNTQGRLNREFAINDSEFVSKVRLGAHNDRERIVLDMVGDNAVAQHQVDIVDGSLILTVSNDLAQASLDLQDFSAGRAISANNQADDMMASPAITAEGSASDASIAAAPPIPHDTTPELTALSIESVGQGQNKIVAKVTSAGAFVLDKTAPSEYVLTLEGAKIGQLPSVAQVAPSGTGQIRSARVVQEGNNVLLRIFAEENSVLSATAQSGTITVSAQGHEAALNEPMGQLADEKKDEKKSDDAKVVVTESNATAAVNEIDSPISFESKYTGRLISLDLQDTDIDNALRIIAEVSNLNIIASDDVTGKVTLRLIDVPWDQALDVILKTNGLDKVQEMNVVRVAPVEKLRAEREALKDAQRADKELQPLVVRYIRISYAKVTEVKPMVESILTERGSVAIDERTNQLIVKDIQEGIVNVAELVRKLDLRTPQVLLETQIVEASRTFLRDLGTELGFSSIQSPATGNPTGYNFPNSIAINGSVNSDGNVLSSFPAAISSTAGSAVTALFGSADGTKTLSARITSLEREGRVRIVSRPAVATINNKQAIIKSVEKIRVRTPDSGLSVATGQNASASGSSSTATETFEVGITLEVTPQASPDYYVLLDINAKSSTLGAQVVDGIPSEIERSATSTVLVSSGQTFALGGIYKISDNDSISGTPFLKDIPVFGTLFRNVKVDNTDEELIFFITPRIVEGSFDDAAMKSSIG